MPFYYAFLPFSLRVCFVERLFDGITHCTAQLGFSPQLQTGAFRNWSFLTLELFETGAFRNLSFSNLSFSKLELYET